MAGVLKHAAAICAVIAPTVNSYKRLVAQGRMSGFTWAAVFVCYGNNNRTNMLRIPSPGGRVEYRAADISRNPYLGGALMLAAGLEGIREEIDPGSPNLVNPYTLTAQQRGERGLSMLPRTLDEAVDAFEQDPLAKSVFCDAMFESLVSYKREEWESYHSAVSEWKQRRYLEFFRAWPSHSSPSHPL